MNCICFEDVSFTYPSGTLANEHLDFTIRQGERVAIVGQNGAGKTTAVKMMNGLHKPTQGEVWVNGINTKTRTTAQLSAQVGFVFQNPGDQIFNTSVQKEVEFWLNYNQINPQESQKRLEKAVDLTGIGAYYEMNPYEIPYSTQKFVTIASVLVAQPAYLILDEPTAGQDSIGIQNLANILEDLHRQGQTVITISHDMEFVAEYFPRVIVMAQRRIIADGTPLEIFQNQSVLEQACIKPPEIAWLAQRLHIKNVIARHQLVKIL